jgi:amidase
LITGRDDEMNQPDNGIPIFHLLETTVEEIHAAYRLGTLTTRRLVELYLDRINAYDRNDPNINSIITINPNALELADRLDETFRFSGLMGPLHGIPVILKDQIDAQGMPTTLGSVMFKDYFPDRDAFVVEKMKQAGAVILAKATLGEMGGGDTHGSLFGSTRNPYDLDRTVGGSSGGSAASVAANFGAIAVGQEAFASIRRPSAWNSIVGMRPTAGLVSRSGVYAGWPGTNASLGPMTRTVKDLAVLLDVLVGYDPEDPITAFGVGQNPLTYTAFLDKNGLSGARIGVLNECMGSESEPDSEDFAKVSKIFDRVTGELKAAGATVINPVVIPRLNELLDKRAGGGGDEAWNVYFGRSTRPPYQSRDEMIQSPDYAKVYTRRSASIRAGGPLAHYEYLVARDELMINLLKVMADHNLDAIVHKSAEHQPPSIREGVKPPVITLSTKGATHLNTFLVYVPSLSVPAGFTSDGLPVGITFLGKPYDDAAIVKLAYSYEQATQHRTPPGAAPSLPGEP